MFSYVNQFLSENWLLLVAICAVVGGVFSAGVWYSGVNKDRDDFREFMAEIRTDIKSILQRLPKKSVFVGSPLQLTEVGRDISLRLNASDVARSISRTLSERVAGKTPFDIQNISFDFIRNEYTPPREMEEELKACAFDNGISREDVLDVLAIEVRDVLLGDRIYEDSK